MSSEQILLRKQTPASDNGAEALQRWRDSSRTLKELADCKEFYTLLLNLNVFFVGLRNLYLDNLADKIDAFTRGDESSVARSTKMVEKKVKIAKTILLLIP